MIGAELRPGDEVRPPSFGWYRIIRRASIPDANGLIPFLARRQGNTKVVTIKLAADYDWPARRPKESDHAQPAHQGKHPATIAAEQANARLTAERAAAGRPATRAQLRARAARDNRAGPRGPAPR